eukprot:PhF_6_TR43613/c0_g1_i2/m.66999
MFRYIVILTILLVVVSSSPTPLVVMEYHSDMACDTCRAYVSALHHHMFSPENMPSDTASQTPRDHVLYMASEERLERILNNSVADASRLCVVQRGDTSFKFMPCTEVKHVIAQGREVNVAPPKGLAEAVKMLVFKDETTEQNVRDLAMHDYTRSELDFALCMDREQVCFEYEGSEIGGEL